MKAPSSMSATEKSYGDDGDFGRLSSWTLKHLDMKDRVDGLARYIVKLFNNFRKKLNYCERRRWNIDKLFPKQFLSFDSKSIHHVGAFCCQKCNARALRIGGGWGNFLFYF